MATCTEKVKNLALVGQGGVGKTMLAEAMLHLTGRTTRLGGHAGTKPTLDYDGEEGERGFSISTAIAPVIWEGTRLNVLDAPCYPDFVGDAYAAMSACETAVFVVDAASGPGTITTRLWYAAEELSLARALFINRLDRPDADFDVAMAALQDRFGSNLGAVTIPMGSGEAFSGIIDVVHMKARYLEGGKPVVEDVPAEYAEAAEAARAQLTELVVEADDEIMMKYLEGEEVTQEELEELLDIADCEKSMPSELSGGQQQRVAIARALVSRPAVVLADEPTGSLDRANGERVVELLRRAQERLGTTIVLVTHDEGVAAAADRVVRISDGRVVCGEE